MDPRLLRYYNQELRYLREMGGQFAREFPKIAARLGMEGLEVADPYVERLIEGCAFLAARVQLKQDAEFPNLGQRLLDMVSPNLGAPVPAMLVAQLQTRPDPNLLAGFKLPRQTSLLGPETALGPTRCEFRTAQEVVLNSLRVASVEYFLNASDLPLATLPLPERPRSGVRIKLEVPQGATFAQCRLDALRFYMGGLQDVALRLHELVVGACVGVLVGAPGRAGDGARTFLKPDRVRPVGYDDEDAMLPVTLRGLAGARLMQEYFAFAQRFLFVEVDGLAPAFAQCSGGACEIVLLFDRYVPALESAGEPANFALNCVPAVNLFERRAERVEMNDLTSSYQVIAERSQPGDYEVFDVLSLSGYTNDSDELKFLPLFGVPQADPSGATGFYSCLREPRVLTERNKREGPRSAYVGTEVFVSLVDLRHAPYRQNLRQLAARVRCTNRDLPMFMPVGASHGELALNGSAPVEAVRVVAGPSRPQGAAREGPLAWRLLSLLSLNYLSMLDESPEQGALALRELLGLFAQNAEAGLKRQIDGVRSVGVRPVVRRHPIPGPIAFGRGLEVRVTVDDLSFEGGSPVLLGSVLHRYFSRHVSMNSFVQTTIATQARGDVKTWAPQPGARALL